MSKINHAFRLDGKVALVPGAARGLGAVTAQVLSQAGAKVMVTDILETEARAIIEAGGEAAFVAHDVVHPGVIDTEMGANFIKGFCELGLAPDLEQSRAGVAAMHPMGRINSIRCATGKSSASGVS